MTFKQTASDVSLCNLAIAKCSETKFISSLDDAGLIASACKRWYKPVVARLLEMHHWGLATKRAPLVAVANDRSSEWLYAYAAPDDMAFPVNFHLGATTGTVSYYRGLGSLLASISGRPVFLHENGVIYTRLEGDLSYVSFDITEADFNATFENLVVLFLAAQLALEIPKDKKLSDAFKDEGVREANVAITQSLNAGRPTYGNRPSQAEYARGGGYGSDWDWFPMSPGEV